MLGLTLAVYQEQPVLLVVGNHLIKRAENLRRQRRRQTNSVSISPSSSRLQEGSFHLLIGLSLFSQGIPSELLQEANGNVVDLVLVEHGQCVRLPAALG